MAVAINSGCDVHGSAGTTCTAALRAVYNAIDKARVRGECDEEEAKMFGVKSAEGRPV